MQRLSTCSLQSRTQDGRGEEHTFALVKESDHAAGVGEVVDLPEWLTLVTALEGAGRGERAAAGKREYIACIAACVA